MNDNINNPGVTDLAALHTLDALNLPEDKVFPRQLLLGPSGHCFRYIREDVRFEHSRFSQAREDVLNFVRDPPNTYLIALFGPSGVGKSTLLRVVASILWEEATKREDWDPSHMAYIDFTIPPPESGVPVWADVYTEYLLAAHEPERLIGHKLRYGHSESEHDGKMGDFSSGGQNEILSRPRIREERRHLLRQLGIVPAGRSTPTYKMRRAVQNAVLYRSPRAVLVDEGQHAAKVGRGGAGRLLDQMDVLKNLADSTQTVHVLAGTYELRSLLSVSDQACRRVVQVHFPRYMYTSLSDMDEFGSTLYSLSLDVPVTEVLNWVDDIDFFYEGSLGCIGILKDWVHRALVSAYSDEELVGGPVLRPKKPFRYYLEKKRLPNLQLSQLLEAIVEGEQLMLEDISETKNIRNKLGMGKTIAARALVPAAAQGTQLKAPTPTQVNSEGAAGRGPGRPKGSTNKADRSGEEKSKGPKPFNRKPGRDSTLPREGEQLVPLENVEADGPDGEVMRYVS